MNVLSRFRGRARQRDARATPASAEQGRLTIVVVYDATNESQASSLVSALRSQPGSQLDVRSARTPGKTERLCKKAKVAVILVSRAIEACPEPLLAASKALPNALVPVVVEQSMVGQQKSWTGAISRWLANELYFEYCDPSAANMTWLVGQIGAKARGERPRGVWHVFLSHEWDVHQEAKLIAQRLESDHRLRVWLDANEIEAGSIDANEAHGIEESKVFLVLATRKYMRKINDGDRADNCLKEFMSGCAQRFDRTVVAALEPAMVKARSGWRGVFQLALARQRPVDLSEITDESVARLESAIRERIRTPEPSADLKLSPAMCDLNAALNPISSQAWAKANAAKFTPGTRSFIFDMMCDWYSHEESPVFVLVGDGGMGKSVIMAKLCLHGGSLGSGDADSPEGTQRRRSSRICGREREPIRVAAYHFFRHDEVTSASAKEALISVAWQLATTIEGFDVELESTLGDKRVNRESLLAMSLAELFNSVLIKPLDQLGRDPDRSPSQRYVVVFDALDECSASGDFLRKVFRRWHDEMPDWLCVIASTRPEGDIERTLANNNLDRTVLELKDEQNLQDVHLHIEHLLGELSAVVEPKDAKECADVLTERSEGLFLWVSFLPDTLKAAQQRKGGALLTAQDVRKEDVIPAGLGGMFEVYFGRLLEKVGSLETYHALLAPIVAAREPLSVDILHVVLGKKSMRQTMDVLDNARNLLYRGGDGRVSLLHKRMADWLASHADSGQLSVDVQAGHERLAKYCSEHDDNRFALRHAIYHLVTCGEKETAFRLLNDFSWLQKLVTFSDDDDDDEDENEEYEDDDDEGEEYEDDDDEGEEDEDDDDEGEEDEDEEDDEDSDEEEDDVEEDSSGDDEEEDDDEDDGDAKNSDHDLTGGLMRDCVELGIFDAKETDALLLLRKITSALDYNPRELASQILARIKESEHPLIQSLQSPGVAWLESVKRSLPHPRDPLQQLLRSDKVYSMGGDGLCVAVGRKDGIVEIWDVVAGERRDSMRVSMAKFPSANSDDEQLDEAEDGARSEDGSVGAGDSEGSEEADYFAELKCVAMNGVHVVAGFSHAKIFVCNSNTHEMLHVLKDHEDAVLSVALSGVTLVSGSADATVRIWDVKTGALRRTLEGHDDDVLGVALQGKIVASGSRDKTARVWDARSGAQLHVLAGHRDAVRSVALESGRVITGSADTTVRVWDARRGTQLHEMAGHVGAVNSVAATGALVVSGSDDRTVRVWEMSTGEQLRVLMGHSKDVVSVRAHGDLMISAAFDDTVRVWDADADEQVRPAEGHTGGVTSLVLDGENLFTASEDKTVRVWSTVTGDLLHVLEGHSDAVRCLQVEGGQLFSASDDATLRAWDARTGDPLRVFESHTNAVTSLAVQEDLIVSASEDTEVRVWDAKTGAIQHVLKDHSAHIYGVAIGEGLVASASEDGTVRVYDACTGEQLRVLEVDHLRVTALASQYKDLIIGTSDGEVQAWHYSGELSKETIIYLPKHNGTVLDVANDEGVVSSGSSDNVVQVSNVWNDPESLRVLDTLSTLTNIRAVSSDVVASASKAVILWDGRTGEKLHVLEGHSGIVWDVALRGGRVVSASEDETARIWDASTGKQLHELKGHKDVVNCVAIGDDFVVSGSIDETVRIWDANTGNQRHVMKGHDDEVWSVAAWAGIVVSGSLDGTARIWDAYSGSGLGVLEEHSGDVNCVAVRENRIVSGSDDETVRIWDVNTREELHILRGHNDAILFVAICSEFAVSGAGSEDKSVRIWSVRTGEQLHVLREHSKAVCALAIEGDCVISGSEDNRVLSWDARSGERLHALEGRSNNVNCVACRDGVAVAGFEDKLVRVWDTETGEKLCVLEGHTDEVLGIALQDGRLVSGSADKTVRVWDVKTGSQRCVLEGHQDAVRTVALNNGRVVSGCADATLRVWNANSGELLHVLEGHSGAIECLRFDGGRVISGSEDKTVRIWNIATGEVERILRGHAGMVSSVAVLGSLVVSGSADGTIRTWNGKDGGCIQKLAVGFLGESVKIRGGNVILNMIGDDDGDDDSYEKLWNARTGEEVWPEQDSCSSASESSDELEVNDTHVRLDDGEISFTTDSKISVWDREGDVIAAGDEAGGVHILRLNRAAPE